VDAVVFVAGTVETDIQVVVKVAGVVVVVAAAAASADSAPDASYEDASAAELVATSEELERIRYLYSSEEEANSLAKRCRSVPDWKKHGNLEKCKADW
jgi:ribosomal protein L12E/L44/L45/RPP1/RPP2